VATVFFAFRDAPERRAALRAPGTLDRYRLFGLDEIRERGVHVRHNLERDGAPPVWARALGKVVNTLLGVSGGYGGDFASAFASLRAANRTDVVFATADTLAIPLLLLKRAGLLRPPVVYTPIGLPERLAQVRRRRLYAGALRKARTIVTYSRAEADSLRNWIGSAPPEIVFVPFGVDVEAFRATSQPADVDVVSIGADPRRDFELLNAIAMRHPELTFRLVATRAQIAALGTLPPHVAVESGIRLEEVRDRLSRARVVALPVRPNSYSGATTVLLQAMALAKPVVVSRTDAIVDGYGLEDGVNCRLVEPGDAAAFERALLDVLADPGELGANARLTVERDFGWGRYIDALWDILSRAWEREPS
jgi:glycosyltransferase involved in cell wall biosynthesis